MEQWAGRVGCKGLRVGAGGHRGDACKWWETLFSRGACWNEAPGTVLAQSLLGLVSLPALVPWLFLLCARPADQQETPLTGGCCTFSLTHHHFSELKSKYLDFPASNESLYFYVKAWLLGGQFIAVVCLVAVMLMSAVCLRHSPCPKLA